ncbi:MAG: hypothetical protein MK102_06770 [Fuerstiella sp.]|nr:hypothetical protein [Fuerstiella sp.]
MTGHWESVLCLDSERRPDSGSVEALTDAIRNGADLRIGTAFRYNEHIDPTSDSDELIKEVMDFRITYLMDDRWVAGIQNLRMPVALPDGFGPRESMSFFLYNQDGHQAIARPYLDGREATGQPGPSPVNDWPDMPKYHELQSFDAETNAPSSNFIYDFDCFRFMVRSGWREVLSHDADGKVTGGDLTDLADSFERGAEVKIAVRGLCHDLSEDEDTSVDHEVFIHLGACYYYTDQRLFMASANPVVRTRPSIPLGYGSCSWDFGWLMPRTDGHAAYWLCDPHTLKFHRESRRHAIRWFVSE